MKFELQKKLDASRDRLVNELDITIGFLATLVAKNIITPENKANIEVSLLHNDFSILLLGSRIAIIFEPICVGQLVSELIKEMVS